MIAVREAHGREALFLLMLTVMVSDTAQYYTRPRVRPPPARAGDQPEEDDRGRGRRLRRSAASSWRWPAAGGCRDAPMPLRAGLGVTVVALGIAGDLFESMLKRSAGVKDSSR